MSTTSPAVQAILELFQGPLADLRFGDVDAKGLSSLAAEVERAAAAVQEQEAHLAELRLSLGQRQDALLALAQRALSYARVYAEGDEALSSQLNAISLPRAPKARKPERAKTSAESEAPEAVAEAVEAAAAEPTVEASESSSVVELEEAAPPVAATGRKGKRRTGSSAREASA